MEPPQIDIDALPDFGDFMESQEIEANEIDATETLLTEDVVQQHLLELIDNLIEDSVTMEEVSTVNAAIEAWSRFVRTRTERDKQDIYVLGFLDTADQTPSDLTD